MCCQEKLYYDRIDVPEGIDIIETGASMGAIIVAIGNFLDKGFKFQPYVCNSCHDVLMVSMNLIDTAILNIHGLNYHCMITRVSKSEAVNLMQNINLSEKSEHYKIYFFDPFFIFQKFNKIFFVIVM